MFSTRLEAERAEGKQDGWIDWSARRGNIERGEGERERNELMGERGYGRWRRRYENEEVILGDRTGWEGGREGWRARSFRREHF